MNWQKFHKRIQGLKAWRASAFILALAERALPNAQLFTTSCDDASMPDAEELQAMLDRSWEILISKPEEAGQVALLDTLVAYIPVATEDAPYGVYPTIDCLELLEQALLSGINQEQPRAVAASQRSVATISHFIEFSEGEALDEDQLIKLFDRHPLMQREYSFQEELCDLLRAANSPSSALIQSLRELASDGGVSNIGISLDEE